MSIKDDLLIGFKNAGNTLSVDNLATTKGTIASNANGSFTITPPANYNGAVTLTYKITDSKDGSVTIASKVLTLLAVNDMPVLVTPTAINYTDTAYDDTFATVTGSLAASDIDGNTLTYGISDGTDNGNGTLSKTSMYGVLTVIKATGAYNFAANDAAIEPLKVNASASFTVTASDGSLSDNKALAISIAQNGTTESTGDDTLTGTSGNDKFNGLAGNDSLDGGLGNDIALFGGNSSGYKLAYNASIITVTDTNLADGNDGTDTLKQIETLRFTNKDLTLVDGLRYIASYGDLINAFKANAEAGLKHYIEYGFAENRTAGFDPEFYLAKYADLRAAFGADLNAATTHYINAGFKEGRSVVTSGNDTLNGSNSADNLNAGAGNDSLKGNAGNDSLKGGAGNDSLDGGLGNDITLFAGNFAGYKLAYNAGVITVADTNPADGNDGTDTLTQIETLRFADKDLVLVDGLRYIASHGDLINAFKTNAEAGLKHYIEYGFAEGRAAGFDPEFYLAKYADLRAVFGADLIAATTHYINAGFKEGRSVVASGNDTLNGSNSADNLSAGVGNDSLKGNAGNDSLDGGLGNDIALFGGNSAGYKLAYNAGVITVTNLADGNDGIDTLKQIETLRFADKDLTLVDGLRYIASYSDLINAFKTNAEAGLKHYIENGFAEGRAAGFDPEFYLAKYADLRAAFGADLNAATTHYINAGFKEGRSVVTSGNDTLNGSNSADNLNGYGGNDILFGMAGDDNLNGGAGNDTLIGGLGNDVLTGGAGQDIFELLDFSKDLIIDFSVADDTIYFKNSAFTHLTATGVLNAANFKIGDAASDANDYVIYNSNTGALLYDEDGNGAGSAMEIAMLGKNIEFTYADFFII